MVDMGDIKRGNSYKCIVWGLYWWPQIAADREVGDGRGAHVSSGHHRRMV